ncbi:MAG: YjgN family protein [Pseudomonadota bacterium]
MSNLSGIETEQFEFRGKAGEWFGIWIVNILLTIITIGIYSAWAKVRTKKYFFNHTFVAGRNFDYHATGKQILIGRLIFIGGYLVFFFLLSALPFLAIILVPALFFLIPWLIVKSLMFNARVSSFSNVRFNFTGGVGRAFVVMFLMPLAAYLVIGVLAGFAVYMGAEQGSFAVTGLLGGLALVAMFMALPIIDRAIRQYSVNNHWLGSAGFSLDITLKPFTRALFFAVAWVFAVAIAGLLLAGVIASSSPFAFDNLFQGAEPTAADVGLLALLYILFFVAFLPAAFIYQALIRNAVFNNAKLEGGHEFRSTVSPARLLWIAISNALVVAISLGFALPWAHVRMQKYMAAQTFLLPGESLDNFVGRQIEEGNSVADAFTDLEGVDFGVPL